MSEGDIPNLGNLMQTAQRMQEKLGQIQQELADKTVEGSSGGGMVVATVNGRQQLVSIRFDKEIVDPDDPEMLQDLIVAAVNQGISKAQELAQQELSKVAGGLPIRLPGLF